MAIPEENNRIIDDPISFFSSLGGLHDARIDKLIINVDAETLELSLNDLNANFVVTPGFDENTKPGNLIFEGVTALYMDVDMYEGIRITDVEVTTDSKKLLAKIDLNLGGGNQSKGLGSITVKFDTLTIRDRN